MQGTPDMLCDLCRGSGGDTCRGRLTCCETCAAGREVICGRGRLTCCETCAAGREVTCALCRGRLTCQPAGREVTRAGDGRLWPGRQLACRLQVANLSLPTLFTAVVSLDGLLRPRQINSTDESAFLALVPTFIS